MKTAVEWLIEILELSNPSKQYQAEIEQAKAMEKQQHGKTWDTALDKYEVRAGNYMRAYEDFDEYYNETFKSE
jgi:hypothetical protein